jgi:glycosyltransferase involved in cell wall biosynthesis
MTTRNWWGPQSNAAYNLMHFPRAFALNNPESHRTMTSPLVIKSGISVLMSVYSKEKPAYFSSALVSLMRQTRPADQIVLVCDGLLTPELDAVIQKHAHALPLTLVRLKQNVGLSHALNAGLPACEREWIARFDSDDVCESFRFERQLEFISLHPEIDVFGGNILEFSTDDSLPNSMRVVRQSHEEIVDAARFKNPMNHVTVFFKNSVISSVGGYPHDVQNEDYALWVKLISGGYRFGNMPESLVRVRGGAEMVSRRGGWAYLMAEVKLQSNFRRHGFIGTSVFLWNISTRVVIRLCPHFVRQFFYKNFLRVRPCADDLEITHK